MKRMIFLPAVAAMAVVTLLGELSAQDDSATPRTGGEGFSGLEATLEQAASDLGMGDTPPAPPVSATNTPYRDCPKVPEVQSGAVQQKTQEGYVRRFIYSYVIMNHVLETGDCTCSGKSAPYAPAQKIEDELRKDHGSGWATSDAAQAYFSQSRALRPKVEALCGGDV